MADNGENGISRLIARADDEISRAIVGIADSVAKRFRKPNPNEEIPPSPVPAVSSLPLSLTPADIDEIDISNHPVVRCIVIFTAFGIGFEWIKNGYFLDLIFMIQDFGKAFRNTIATQVQQPKPLKRCLTFSNYSRTPHLKGLKGMRETYLQQTNGYFRQEVEQHQEDTSRAVVPSSGSTVDDPKSPSFSLLVNGSCK